MAASSSLLLGICMLVIVQVTLCAPAAGKGDRCCAMTFEGKIRIAVGQVSPIPQASVVSLCNGTMHADFAKMKKVAVEETVTGHNFVVNMRVIEDLAAKVMYFIYTKDRKCMKVPLPGGMNMAACPYGMMQFTGSETIGLGPESLEVNVFEAKYPAAEMITTYYATKKQCAPVFQTFISSYLGTQQSQGQVYSDLSLEIKDPSVFNVPDYCHKSNGFEVNQIAKDAISRHRARRSMWA